MTTRARRTPEPWPLVLMALLAAMIGTGVAFYQIAAHHPDAVIADAYQTGLHYSEGIRAAERARALGWQLDVRTEVQADGARAVATLRDAAGAPLTAERVTLRRERPAEGGYDEEFVMARSGESYTKDVSLPRRGRWQLVALAEREGERIERRVAVWLP
jgi:nitrogen fixation protein FixH